MPKLMNQSATIVQNTISNFGFSGKRIDELKASEYTLADLEIDLSSSVSGFVNDLRKALESVVDSLGKSPRSENMLLRVGTFNSTTSEVHGFIPLKDIDKSSYQLDADGSTALFDATLLGIEAVGEYGKSLDAMDYGVNGVVFIATDGDDNNSRTGSINKIKATVDAIRREEKLESIKIILIGIGDETRVKPYLDQFYQDAALDQFIWIGEATPNKLAKLADFISRSISSSSQALGSGGPSQNLTF